jgi:diguanylate cyclase (GGDEF)-like protein
VIGNAIERREEEERTRYEALHDPLTGLPNRNLFLDRLGRTLAQTQRRQTSAAVIFLDLDQFKLVNDSLGHAAGDELLSAVAPRLEQALRPSDTIARFGGDEFAILADVRAERDAIRVAERIKTALRRPFKLRYREHFVSASMGISIGSIGKEPEAMIRDADAALYRAKERGRGGYEIFDSAMRARAVEHMRIENDLRRSLDREELELQYQPIVSLRDGSIVALEALMRWRHPEYGLTSPAAFIPVAEDSQLIVPIGRWLVEEACGKAAKWQAMRPDAAPVRIAVNLSGKQIGDPELLPSVSAAIEASGIDPATLSFELTESVIFEESAISERTMRSLRGLGVRLALDDFGSGFSSLGYLKRFPLDGIKLDRSFIENVADGHTDAQIVRAVVQMARALGLEIVAEGVETAEQLAAVRELGCHQAQGFYFLPPVPADEVPGMLADAPWQNLGAEAGARNGDPAANRRSRTAAKQGVRTE